MSQEEQERLLALKEEIVYNCPEIKVKTITADLSKEEQCFGLYNKVKDYKIDFLFNNAGFGLYGPFLETDLKDELSMINVNIKAVHILTKLFLRDFAARNSGYILNTASVAGFMAGPLLATYYATKKLCRTAYQGGLRGTEKHRQQGSDKRTLPRTCRYRIQQRCRRKELRNTESENEAYVADYAIERLLCGDLLIIPGVTTKAAAAGSRFAPTKFLLRTVRTLQEQKNK